LNKLYIIFFYFVLFINVIFITSLNANSFKITNLEILEPFELNFNKEKVIDKGFKIAFLELASMITTSGDKEKIKNTPISVVKELIDSFTMSNEKFINNEYIVKFNVNFNKKNTLSFFEKKNIFPSIPQKKKLLLVPVIVDLQEDKIFLFTDNIFYKDWNKINEKYFLLNYILPSEDIEDLNFVLENKRSIEEYDFKKTISKYDLNDYIIAIIYKNFDEITVLSKIYLDESFKINNQKFNDIDLSDKNDLNNILTKLKNIYEDHWKNINQINTSIKLPLTVYVEAKDYIKITNLEKSLAELDLVSNFEILKFDNEKIYFKLIYNGSPNKFIKNVEKYGIKIDTSEQVLRIK
jgi:hypothetical protein